MAEQMSLSGADVQRLLHDPSPASREEMAAKIARAYGAEGMNQQERTLAGEIFRLMLRDAEWRVRRALAENLRHNPDVPADIARTLAADMTEVSVPFIEASSVLTDADLVQIVEAGLPEKQFAVARRADVSSEVSLSIARHGVELAVASLMENAGAEIGGDAFNTALDRFGTLESVHGPMVRRAHLPIGVAERLVSLVSAELRDHLVANHDLPADIATDLVLQSRERATVDLSRGAGRDDVQALVLRLHATGRLTNTIILRALCTGDLNFFECAMAQLAGIPVANAFRLIHDGGELGLPRLVERCGLPDSFLEIARVGVAVARELEYDGQPGDRQRFTDRMVERILTNFEDDFESGNLDYLIGRLGREPKLAVVAA